MILSFVLGFSLLSYFQKPPRGTITLNSIKGNAQIRFDGKYSIPYITGTSKESVMFALGYVHAMDRLYDLHSKRALAYGKFAEMVGEQGVMLDKYMRSLMLERAVERDLKNLTAEDLEPLEAYAAGINAYAEEALMLPAEFQVLGVGFDPWTVKDSAMVVKLMSFVMSCGWQLATLRSGIAEAHGKELADRLIAFSEENSFLEQVRIIQDEDLERMGLLRTPENQKQMKEAEVKVDKKEPEKSKKEEKVTNKTTSKQNATQAAKSATTKEPIGKQNDTNKEKIVAPNKTRPNPSFTNTSKGNRENRSIPHTPPGSNAWAISGNYTVSGYPYLSTDPHLSHKIPGMFYLASFQIPNGPTTFGATYPGVPWVVIGRNEFVAWGITVSYLEVADLFSIRHNKTHYFYNNTWVPLTVHKHKIAVRSGEQVYYESYETHHGPLLQQPAAQELGSLLGVGNMAFMERPLAFAWAGVKDVDRTVKAFKVVNYARSVEDLVDGLKMVDSLAMSFVFATVLLSSSYRGEET